MYLQLFKKFFAKDHDASLLFQNEKLNGEISWSVGDYFKCVSPKSLNESF